VFSAHEPASGPLAPGWPAGGGPADPASGQPAAAAMRQPYRPSPLVRIGEELLAWFKTLVSAAVYATLIVTFGFQVARVEGQSMAPTLEDQDRLIVNKLAYRIGKPQVGDIVMLYYPREPEKSFVKRVVAGPGDTIRSVNGRLFLNEVPLRDDFIPEGYIDSHDTWGPRSVPDAHYFVMGDHRNNSSDSRTWDWVPERYIIGRVELRWWPVGHVRMFDTRILPPEPKSIQK
jgi:signal peptidase I